MAFRHGVGPLAGKWQLAGSIVRETPRAVLFRDQERGGEAWLPKRFLKIEPRRDGLVDASMPEWLARKQGYV